ncbi:MAG TPA: hypothetical protein VH142_10270 [Polyangiaceae bacterium]|jgi:hypothetical protein|nr:hypothetical protein [Polyangiaceae bacterium]
MFLVAIAELAGPVDASVAPLAADLNTTAYELKLLLNGGLPAVVLATVDEGLARAAIATVKRHKHVPVTCDRRLVVPSARMTALSAFAFSDSGVTADERGGEELPWSDIGALLRATLRSSTETTQEIKERKFRPGMALATGGMVLSKKVTREVTTRTEHREQALYLFRRSGAPPWVLNERGTRYGGLGADLRPTSLDNFQTAIRRIRERAPGAAYDERLMNGRPMRGVAEGSTATDLFAYLLAKYLMRGSAEP